jgi:hypothetical protein
VDAKGGDVELAQVEDFVGGADAVGIAVLPEADAGEFLAGKEAVGVVVQGSEGVVAVLPKHPEGDAAEHLQGGGDGAALGKVNDPGGVGRNPLPFAPGCLRAVEIECDCGVRVDQV